MIFPKIIVPGLNRYPTYLQAICSVLSVLIRELPSVLSIAVAGGKGLLEMPKNTALSEKTMDRKQQSGNLQNSNSYMILFHGKASDDNESCY